jgi:Na+/proline symporter
MSPLLALGVLILYFGVLMTLAASQKKDGSNAAFFTADRNAPWYLVAFGMIGASLSGVTFISIPGYVGKNGWSYFGMVLGYWVGYWCIRNWLLPLYYKQNLISIYGYLKGRYGLVSYRTGACFFILSRLVGSALRLYLVAKVLEWAIFQPLGLPFWLAVAVSVLLIFAYTFQGGMRTIVFTDTIQTAAMLTAAVLTIVLIANQLNWDFATTIQKIIQSDTSRIWYGDPTDSRFFIKNIVAGIFITVVMTGLDQDMMQKNLSCRSLEDSQKNMKWFSAILIGVNLLFLALGSMLYLYCEATGYSIPAKSDALFSSLAFGPLGLAAGIVFLVGVTSAAYSSADSALTALTTSFCIDIAGLTRDESTTNQRLRRRVHFGFTLLMIVLVLLFDMVESDSVVSAVFTYAGYTYGPLLGLFAFGMLHKYPIHDKYVLWVCLIAPALTAVLQSYSKELLYGYSIGFELIVINGLLSYLGLWMLRKK